jgi:hypothetical protein
MSRTEVKFKAKSEDVAPQSLFDEAPAAPEVKVPKGWEALPEPSVNYPYNGQPIWLTENGVDAIPATWRVTRSYDGVNVKWVHDSYWARHNAGGQRLEITPIAYKRMED